LAKTKYSKSELQIFEKNINEKMGDISDNIHATRSTSSNKSSIFLENNTEDHNEGTEAHEVEKSFLLMSRESDYIVNLKKALQRIKDGTYGICQVYQTEPRKCECPSSPLIEKERLLEVPNATKGVFCKQKKKLNLV
jgi:DnaK suppressor protein|tara:strand:- start:525 stop:935 length:411 start_codon:yes stop_codon:yes gene_type:complete